MRPGNRRKKERMQAQRKISNTGRPRRAMTMRSTIVASIGLALGLSVGSARAQDIQWRPVAPATAAQPTAPAVGLRAPVAYSAPVRQTSFSSTSPSEDGTLVRAKGNDGPAQPLPIGPILSDSEQGPAPTVV